MAFACCMNAYMVSVHTGSTYKENSDPNPNSHYHCCTEQVEMSYTCAYSSVQVDKSRVEKEFT